MASATSPVSPHPPSAIGARLLSLAVAAGLFGIVLGRRRRDTPDPEPEPPPPTTGLRSFSGNAAHRVARREADRGRLAERPGDLPAKGWRDVAWRVVTQFSQNRLLSVAAGVTFYALLALFPSVAALVSLYGLFADASVINTHLAAMADILPGGAIEIVSEQVRRIASSGEGTLGLAFFTSLAISLWSANAGMKAIFDALNVVYQEDEKRSFVMLNLRSLAFTAGAILFLMLALGAIVVTPLVLAVVPLGSVLQPLISLARWPLLLVATPTALMLLYRFGPSREPPKWRWLTWGSVVATVLWLGGSMLFSWYVGSFGNYNETYGSLGAAIGFMTWIWLSATTVLVGATINAEMEHQTVRDTTTGTPRPLGLRGARVADTLGEAQ